MKNFNYKANSNNITIYNISANNSSIPIQDSLDVTWGGESRSIKIDQFALKPDILSWEQNYLYLDGHIRLTSAIRDLYKLFFVLNSTQQYNYFYIGSSRVNIGQPFYITSTGVDIDSTSKKEYIKCVIIEDTMDTYKIFTEVVGNPIVDRTINISISKSGLMNIISTIQLRIVKDA